MYQGVLLKALAYIVYKRERNQFPIVCTFNKAINSFEVNIDSQKEARRFRETHGNSCASFIQVVFSSIVVIWSQFPKKLYM